MLEKPTAVLEPWVMFLSCTGIFSGCLLVWTFPVLEYHTNCSMVRIRMYALQDCPFRKYWRNFLVVSGVTADTATMTNERNWTLLRRWVVQTPMPNTPPQWKWHIEFSFNSMFHLIPSYGPIKDSDSSHSPMRCNADFPTQFIELEPSYPVYSKRIKS